MAKINIEFDGKIYSIDESTLASLASPLEQVLIQQLAGTGAVIRFRGNDYNVNADKLASARNVLTDQLGNVEGTDSKVVVGGVEFGLSTAKLQDATDKMTGTFDGLANPPKESSQGLEYSLNDDEASYSVTGIGTCEDEEITIPSTHEGLPVTIIGYEAFAFNDTITGVVIPDTVTDIDDGAFSNCENLKTIIVPDSVTYMGDSAFSSCVSLESLTLPQNLPRLAGYLFAGCASLNSIIIPDSVSEIMEGAFSDCSNLKSIIIPDNVTYIEGYAFGNCENLRSVTIGASVETIYSDAFEACTNLNEIHINQYEEGSSLDPWEWLIYCDEVYDEEADEWLAEEVYAGDQATVYWNSTSPGEEPDEPEEPEPEEPDEPTLEPEPEPTSLAYSLNSDGQSYSVAGLGSCSDSDIVIASEYEGLPVTGISYRAFRNCTGLTSVTIPNSVASIGEEAFSGCRSLVDIVIPGSVLSISNRAFSGCSGLTSVTIENGVAEIGQLAFTACSKLVEIVIPDSVRTIDSYAFWQCSNLESIFIGKGTESISDVAFSSCFKLKNFEVDSDNSIYKSLDGNLYQYYGKTLHTYTPNKQETRFVIPDGVEYVNSYAFELCQESSALKEIEVPNSMTHLSSRAFWSCESVTKIRLPDKDMYIGDGAFHGCSQLTDINLPSNIDRISDNLFDGCGKLTNIVIPNTVSHIGKYAFSNCSSLTSLTLPDNLISIDDEAFSYCDGLVSIVIPSNVTDIGSGVFNSCKNLTDITVADGNSTYKSVDGNLYTMDGKTLKGYALGKPDTHFDIPEGVETLEVDFYESHLTSISIPSTIVEIPWLFADYERDKYFITDIYIDKPKDSIDGAPWCSGDVTVHWSDASVYYDYDSGGN